MYTCHLHIPVGILDTADCTVTSMLYLHRCLKYIHMKGHKHIIHRYACKQIAFL